MPSFRVIDGDGHIWEDADGISRCMPAVYRDKGPFSMGELVPPNDHFHFHKGESPPGSFRQVGPDGWLDFMADVGIASAVLYPSHYLSYGRIPYLDWAIAVTRAYNDWLHATYLSRDPRLQGMALLPMQEPEAAAAELRRAVKELGMRGAMLPATGLKDHLGAREYWPVYQEADRLGCCLTVHGGSHSGLGFDHLNVYTPVHSLGHPFGQMIAFSGIVFNGILDRYPNARFGFLEGGVAWLLLLLERFDRSHETHVQFDPRKEISPAPEERVSDYILGHIKAGRLVVGCEGSEPDLAYAVSRVGAEAFIYSSDFPHEVNNAICKHELEEIIESRVLTEDAKQAILHRNAERFYRLAPR